MDAANRDGEAIEDYDYEFVKKLQYACDMLASALYGLGCIVYVKRRRDGHLSGQRMTCREGLRQSKRQMVAVRHLCRARQRGNLSAQRVSYDGAF